MRQATIDVMKVLVEEGEGYYAKSTVLDTELGYNRRKIGQSLWKIGEMNCGIKLSKWSDSEPYTYYVESIDNNHLPKQVRDADGSGSKGHTPP